MRSLNKRVVKKRQINQIIHLTQTLDESDLGNSDFQDALNKEYPMWFRLLWLVTIFVCFCVCAYQIRDRILYFLTYPSAVDIKYTENVLPEQVLPPIIKICSAESPFLNEAFLNTTSPSGHTCFSPMFEMMTKLETKNVKDYNRLWDFIDAPPHILSVDVKPESEKQNLKTYDDTGFLGRCKTVEFKTSPKATVHTQILANTGKLCPRATLIVNMKHKMNFTIGGYPLIKNNSMKFRLDLRQYNFINTPINDCVNDDEYISCYENCLIKRFNNEMSCRLPFFHPQINLKPCTTRNATEAFAQAVTTELNPKIFKLCNCRHSCINAFYSPSIEMNILKNHLAYLEVYVNNFVTHLSQRRTYYIGNIIIDSAGSLGLFLGLSLLGMIDIINRISYIIKKHKEARRITKKGKFLFYKVTSIYKKVAAATDNSEPEEESNKKMQILQYSMCVIFTLLILYQRLDYYLSIPITKAIVLEEQEFIQYPPLTLCGHSAGILFLKMNYAKEHSIPLEKMCDVDIFDLFNPAQKNALEKLYKRSFFQPLDQLVKAFTIFDMIKATGRKVDTHLGTCWQYIFNLTEYRGFFTMHPIIFTSTDMALCKRNYYQIFYDDIDSDSYNILNEIHGMIGDNLYSGLSLSRINRINTPANPCVEREQHKTCKSDCLTQKIKNENFCRLPFLSLPNATTCTSTADAKSSRDKYLEIVVNVSVGACKCVQPCQENILKFSSYSQPLYGSPVYMYLFFMLTNVREDITEEIAYPIIAFICDIGNIIGMNLGMSILTLARQLPISFRFIKYKLTN